MELQQLKKRLAELEERMVQLEYVPGGPGYLEALLSFQQRGGRWSLGNYPTEEGHVFCFDLDRALNIRASAVYLTGSFIDWSNGYPMTNLKDNLWYVEVPFKLTFDATFKFRVIDGEGTVFWCLDYNSPCSRPNYDYPDHPGTNNRLNFRPPLSPENYSLGQTFDQSEKEVVFKLQLSPETKKRLVVYLRFLNLGWNWDHRYYFQNVRADIWMTRVPMNCIYRNYVLTKLQVDYSGTAETILDPHSPIVQATYEGRPASHNALKQ